MSTLKTRFDAIAHDLERSFVHAPVVDGARWQSTKAPAPMVELFNRSFSLLLEGEDLDTYRDAIRPNLPWADRHFEEERVSGEPINPGWTWKIWPYGHSAEKFIADGGQYDHSYAERYWPAYAGQTEGGRQNGEAITDGMAARGIRFPIGDLNDLVDVLVDDPTTRQAYLPIFFPEDIAAAAMGKRVPCTLGYHFIVRDGRLHVIYPMRSCDFVRHFRDDVYLTIRLLLWVLDRCRERSPEEWVDVTPGTFRMHITSLHMFVPDRQALVYRLGQQS
jgi:hypothetical protein